MFNFLLYAFALIGVLVSVLLLILIIVKVGDLKSERDFEKRFGWMLEYGNFHLVD